MIGNQLLHGNAVYLDALDRADIPLLGAWWRSIELSQFLSQDAIFPQTEEDETAWFESMRKDRDSYVFAIRRIDTDALVGTTSLFQFNWRTRKCLFGIALGDPTVWGKGYGTDATQITLRYAFQELNMNRVQLYVYEFNERAKRVYEKTGFRVEGRLRQSSYREGKHYDEFVMAILREDWEASQ